MADGAIVIADPFGALSSLDPGRTKGLWLGCSRPCGWREDHKTLSLIIHYQLFLWLVKMENNKQTVSPLATTIIKQLMV